MGTTSTRINAIVDAVKTDISNSATTLGFATGVTIYERDEHPQAAMNRGDLPCAYVIPIMEGGDMISTDLDDLPHTHMFPITVVAYYMGTDLTASVLQSDLRTYRNYAYDYVDIYKTKSGGPVLACTSGGAGYIKDFKVDVGYWISGGGQVVHYWIVKMNVTTMIA